MKSFIVGKKEKNGEIVYSAIGFVVWATQAAYAKKYTREEAEQFVKSCPAHMEGVFITEVK